MDNKATINGRSRPDSAGRALAEHVAAMARDVARIGELQAQLFARDAREVWPRVLRGAGAGLAGALLVLVMLPVALAGFGLWLAELTELSPAGGLLCAAAAAVVLAAIAFALARHQFLDQRRRFERSAGELRENWAAVTHAFAQCARGRDEDE